MSWKQGDIAICIDNSPAKGTLIAPPLRLNLEYVVHAVNKCKCGRVLLDVGIYCPSEGIECSECNNIISDGSDGVWWCYSKRFRKKEYADEVFKQVFSEEEA